MIARMQKFAVPFYRAAAALTLYGLLLFVVCYAFAQIFFALNTTWAAPFIITRTNDKILDMTGKLVASQQSLTALALDRNKLQASLGGLRQSKAELEGLDRKFQNALLLERRARQIDSPDLVALQNEKAHDLATTMTLLTEVREVQRKIDADLNAGMITKGDAAVAKTQLQNDKNTFTDSRIAAVLLRDNIRQKQLEYGTSVSELSKEAELQTAIIKLTRACFKNR